MKKRMGKSKRLNRFPPGWNDKRVRELIEHYDRMSDEEWTAEDEAARNAPGETWMSVPTKLVSAVRELIKRSKSSTRKTT